jgi:type III secretion system FlhB-like substrate exporter
MPLDDFYKRYPLRKAKALRKQYEDSHFKSTKQNFNYDCFVKTDEKQISFDSTEPRPRMISGPKAAFKVAHGSFITPLTSALGKALPSLCYLKDRSELEEWFNFSASCFIDPVAICLDGSSFDSTQLACLLEVCDVEFYRLVFDTYSDPFGRTEACNEYIDHSTYHSKYDLHYKIHGTVPSGKPNTTEANTRRATYYFYYCCCLAGVQARIIAKGDDTLAILSRSDVSAVEQAIAVAYCNRKPKVGENLVHGLGQIAKMVNVVELDDAEFISCRFMRQSPLEWRIIRDPARVVGLEGYALNRNNMLRTDDAIRGFMYANAMQNLEWARGVPIFEAFYTGMAKNGRYNAAMEREVAALFEHKTCGGTGITGLITSHNRNWFSQKYNITIAEQRNIERKLANLNIDDYMPLEQKEYWAQNLIDSEEPECVYPKYKREFSHLMSADLTSRLHALIEFNQRTSTSFLFQPETLMVYDPKWFE